MVLQHGSILSGAFYFIKINSPLPYLKSGKFGSDSWLPPKGENEVERWVDVCLSMYICIFLLKKKKSSFWMEKKKSHF